MLFLELSLIRWTGSQIVHLSYFSNFVLLGSFLGIGLGFLRAGKPDRGLPLYSPVALLALVGFVSAFPVTVDRQDASIIFFTSLSTSGPPIWVTLPIIFLSVAAIMAGPGELVADCFHDLERLDAYRLDLIGSLVGIGVFTACSFLGAPPLVWFTLVAVLFIVLLGPTARSVSVTLLIAMVAMFAYPLMTDEGVFWSPYYEVTTFAEPDGEGGQQFQIYVNGIPHQRLTTAETRLAQESFYAEPYARATNPPKDVLIVGAGTGTDVSIALTEGVEHVDAVEIDPKLLQFGRDNNPDRAYQDPRVTAHVNDGRAFLERTDKKYDLILFALPDSLTLVSGASALRLESYLFTSEAMESAQATSGTRWRLRDVQLLSRALARRPAREHLGSGLRTSAVRAVLSRGHLARRAGGRPRTRGSDAASTPGFRQPPRLRPRPTTTRSSTSATTPGCSGSR